MQDPRCSAMGGTHGVVNRVGKVSKKTCHGVCAKRWSISLCEGESLRGVNDSTPYDSQYYLLSIAAQSICGTHLQQVGKRCLRAGDYDQPVSAGEDASTPHFAEEFVEKSRKGISNVGISQTWGATYSSPKKVSFFEKSPVYLASDITEF